jgi:hypothetical protein
VPGGGTGGVPGIGTVAGIGVTGGSGSRVGSVDGIGVTGGSGRRVGSVGGGSSYAVGMWVCAVGGGGGTNDGCIFSTRDLIRQLYTIDVQLAEVAEVVVSFVCSAPAEAELKRLHILRLRYVERQPTKFWYSFTFQHLNIIEYLT